MKWKSTKNHGNVYTQGWQWMWKCPHTIPPLIRSGGEKKRNIELLLFIFDVDDVNT